MSSPVSGQQQEVCKSFFVKSKHGQIPCIEINKIMKTQRRANYLSETQKAMSNAICSKHKSGFTLWDASTVSLLWDWAAFNCVPAQRFQVKINKPILLQVLDLNPVKLPYGRIVDAALLSLSCWFQYKVLALYRTPKMFAPAVLALYLWICCSKRRK